MMLDFKIYVTTLNEECLISYTLEALLRVFPPKQIEVIDIGSEDATLSRIPSSVKVHTVPLPHSENRGQLFTALKNEYSAKQGLVLWVDGDEIYPTSSLERVKKWVEGEQNCPSQTGCRLYWRILREKDSKLECSREFLSAGPKLFNTSKLRFKRAWPKEVTVKLDPDYPDVEPKGSFNGVWFWHGVLLKRSSIGESGMRYKKRQTKEYLYSQHLSWDTLDCFPWESNYQGVIERPWAVVNMSPNDGGYRQEWNGNRLHGSIR